MTFAAAGLPNHHYHGNIPRRKRPSPLGNPGRLRNHHYDDNIPP
jgi:hypothetical protein